MYLSDMQSMYLIESQVGSNFYQKMFELQFEPDLRFVVNNNTNSQIVRNFVDKWLFVLYQSLDAPMYKVYVYDIS